MAKSILLSDSYYLGGRWRRRSKSELIALSERIRAGEDIEFNEDHLRELLDQKKLVDSVSGRALLLYLLKALWPGILVAISALALLIHRIAC